MTSLFRCLTPVLIAGFLAPASIAAAQGAPSHMDRLVQANIVQRVTFWGEPYPYGYARVQAHRKCRWKRVDIHKDHKAGRTRVCWTHAPFEF